MSSRSASSASVASGVSRRASATRRTTYGCSTSRPSASSCVDRVELPPGRSDGALQVGRLGVEDTVQLAAKRTRHLPGLELEQRAGGPDPAEERAHRLGTLPRHDPSTAADPPRCRKVDLTEPSGEDLGLLDRDDEFEMGPAAGQAERPAGQEPAAQPRGSAVVGRSVPVEGCDADAIRLGSSSETMRQTCHRRLPGRHLDAQACRLGETIAWSRRVDAGELVP